MSNTEQFIQLDETYLPYMAELYKKAFGQEPWNDDWSDEHQLAKYIKEIANSYHSLNYGLLINGKLAALSIGMIRHWWEGTNYNIEEFCVSPDIQGQGIGSRFMKMIEEDVKKEVCVVFFFKQTMTSRHIIFIVRMDLMNLNRILVFIKE